MKTPVLGLKTILAVTVAAALTGCAAAKQAADAASDSGSGSVVTNELAAFAGIRSDTCTPTANINGVSAWVRNQLSINSDGSGMLNISYYDTSACTQTGGHMSIWIAVPVTYSYASDVGSAKLFHVVTVSNSYTYIYSKNANGASHLNNGATGCSYNMFSSNGGYPTGGGFTCSGDSRFNVLSAPHSADLLLELSGGSLMTSSMSSNIPGVATGTAGSSTSLTWN